MHFFAQQLMEMIHKISSSRLADKSKFEKKLWDHIKWKLKLVQVFVESIIT